MRYTRRTPHRDLGPSARDIPTRQHTQPVIGTFASNGMATARSVALSIPFVSFFPHYTFIFFGPNREYTAGAKRSFWWLLFWKGEHGGFFVYRFF